MPSFQREDTDDIENLRELLAEKYSPAVVFRELLQNADDAQARGLYLSVLPAKSDAANPLLSVPGLLVINDGIFQAGDAKGITQLRSGTKTADVSAIGKFGLGLKSVFHFGEGFVYAASRTQPGAHGKPFLELLNPWGREFHAEWETDMTGLWEQMDQHAARCFPAKSPWFAIYVPLRTLDLCAGIEPIRAEYPSLNSLFSSNLASDLSRHLPMLKHISRIVIMEPTEAGGAVQEVTLEAHSARRAGPEPWQKMENTGGTQRPAERTFAGIIRITRREGTAQITQLLSYLGREGRGDLSDLDDLKKGVDWPRRFSTAKDGKREQVREKAEQHAAVLFLRNSDISSGETLRMNEGVFFPLAHTYRDGSNNLNPALTYNTEILLHGYYFLDSGRQRRLEKKDDAVRGGWNDTLLRDLTLPLLLPTFAKWAAPLPPSEVAELTQRLGTMLQQAFPDMQDAVYQQFQWIAAVTTTGVQWRLLPADAPYYQLPEPHVSHTHLPFLLFPTLAHSDVCVTTAPSLCLTNHQPGDLANLAFLFTGFSELPVKALQVLVTDAEARKYLEDILENVGKRLPLSIWKALWQTFRSVLAATTLTGNSVAAFAQFTARTVGFLPNETEAVKRSVLGDIALFRVYDEARTGEDEQKTRLASWNELVTCREQRTLFTQYGQVEANALSAALAAPAKVLRVADSVLLERLFGLSHAVSGCDRNACLEILRTQRPTLAASPDSRLPLLQIVKSDNKGQMTPWRNEIRYLLHGDVTAFDGTQFELYAPLRGKDVWARLWQQVLEEENLKKQVVDSLLTDNLNALQKEVLGIHEISVEKVADKLDQLYQLKGIETLKSLPWRPAEDSVAVLTALGSDKRLERRRLWRALPLHQCGKDSYVSLEAEQFVCRNGAVGSESVVPTAVSTLILALCEPTDRNLASLYDEEQVLLYHPKLAVEAICATGKPQEYENALLPALARAYETTHLPAEICKKLRDVRWLAAENGTFLSPSDIIYLPGLESNLARLLTRPSLRGTFSDVEAVASRVREHTAWKVIERDLLPPPNAAFAMLTEAVAEDATFVLGTGRVSIEAEKLLKAFAHERNEPWQLLYAVQQAYPDRLSALVNGMQARLLSRETRAAILRDLQTRLQTGQGDKQATESAFRFFLGQVETALELREIGIHLRSIAGDWRSPAQLCRPDEEGIDNSYRIHADLYEILAKPLHREEDTTRSKSEGTEVNETLVRFCYGSAAAAALEEYFSDWNVPQSVIGGFLTALASDPAILPLAKRCHGGVRNIDVDRREMGLPIVDQERRDQGDFAIRLLDGGGTVYVHNLWGENVAVPTANDAPHFLLGRPNRAATKRPNCTALTLRVISTDRERTPERVKASLEIILHFLEGTLEDKLWRQFSEPDRTDLVTAQHLIAQSLPFYANQLKKEDWRTLRPVLKELDDLRYREEQARQIVKDYARDKLRTDRENGETKLRNLLETNPKAHHELISGVRGRIEEFQYTPDSVPFELFQNADDACIERAELESDPAVAKFYIFENPGGLIVVHNGRPINRYSSRIMHSENGRARGFHRDLEKMLVMSFSDKNDGANTTGVTGKFGLGFKATLLYSDKPTVLSDALGFRVIGGVYPVALGQTEKETLQAHRNHAEIGDEATIISLPRRTPQTPDVLKRFEHSLPYLLAFARKIKTLQFADSNGTKMTHEWRESPITEGVYRGESKTEKCLVLRGDEGGALLLRLGARGIETLPSGVPTFWVTAPTREGTITGYAINGPFSVDVGRAQLAADSAENKHVADKLAQQVAKGFSELFDMQWHTAADALRFATSDTPSNDRIVFWESVWQRLSVVPDGSDGARNIVKRVLWGEQGNTGYGRFLLERTALPSGLTGDYRVLLSLGDVRFVVTGLLNDAERFAQVAQWDGFLGKFLPGSVISQKVNDSLEEWHIPTRSHAKPLRLVEVVRELFPSDIVSPKSAGQWGRVIARDFFSSATSKDASEIKELQRALHGLHFRSVAGTIALANTLVFAAPGRQGGRDAGDAHDEALRVGFAPTESVLSDAYLIPGEDGDRAIAFLLACRDNQVRRINTETLTQWGRAARTDESRFAFLHYLLEGQLASTIAEILRKPHERSWLDVVQKEPVWKRFNEAEQGRLSALLALSRADLLERIGQPSQAVGAVPNTFNEEDEDDHIIVASQWSHEVTREKLKRMADDWARNGAERLSQYDRKRYPGNADDLFGRLRGDTSAMETRVAWITMLLSGSLETIGRAQPEAHRNFLQLCAQQGWLRALAVENTQNVLRSFGQWLDSSIQEVKYASWAKELLPGIFLSQYLEDYIQAFMGQDSWRGATPFAMHRINAPRTTTGGDGPPLKPFLGIGTHFVLRELLRKGVLSNQRLHSAAFVPGNRVLRWAGEHGASFSADDSHETNARSLHEWLLQYLTPEEATFGGAFDIALREASHDES